MNAFTVIASTLAAALNLPGSAAVTVERSAFGFLPDGRAVEAVTLAAPTMRVRILSYGAILQAVEVPDRSGRLADVALGYADLAGYLAKPNYFGATVGRYANRIKGGRFVLDGKTFKLATNNGANALHGGLQGYDKRLWTIVDSGSTTDGAQVTLRYVSADGEEGYPGALTVTARYTLDAAQTLTVDYSATTTKPTIVNLTNHSFWNLAGEGAQAPVYDHRLTIPAETTTPVDPGLIPTGAFRAVAGTPLDFRTPTPIGLRIRDGRDPQIVYGQGYDENYVVSRAPAAVPQRMALLEHPGSGRTLEVLSNQPGLQFYSGNFLDGSAVGKSGHAYRQGDGLALEPQCFPDTPNQPQFGSARLDPGQTYLNRIVFRFGLMGR